MKERLFVSFSGGRTSAVMTKICFDRYRDTHEIVVMFANTGCEHEATLKFVNDCDRDFGWGVIWIEAVFSTEQGVGATPKVVTYETAAREGEPMLGFIRTEGLPSPSNGGCTSRLKERVMHKYIRSVIGWKKGTYDTAIGLRADEMDRVSKNYKQERFVYPLLDMGVTKDMVRLETQVWRHDLEIPSDAYGNCTWCFKKSKRKLMTLAIQSPEVFCFIRRMEKQFAYHKLNGYEKSNRVTRKVFRGMKTATGMMFEALNTDFQLYEDDKFTQAELFNPLLDHNLGCGSSCEIGH